MRRYRSALAEAEAEQLFSVVHARRPHVIPRPSFCFPPGQILFLTVQASALALASRLR